VWSGGKVRPVISTVFSSMWRTARELGDNRAVVRIGVDEFLTAAVSIGTFTTTMC